MIENKWYNKISIQGAEASCDLNWKLDPQTQFSSKLDDAESKFRHHPHTKKDLLKENVIESEE